MLLRASLSAALIPRRAQFAWAVRNPRTAQERVRRRIVAALAHTEYGRSLGVTGVEDYARFATRVPKVDYEDMEPWIVRQMETTDPVVVADPVVVYEETSGSSGRPKYIPYTAPLLQAFNGMFLVWIGDLLARGPRFRTGKIFFSISPASRTPRTTASGVPIGLTDDAQYFSPRARTALGTRLVVPPKQSLRLHPTDYRLVLACTLLAAEDLEIISIWSPTYLLALMEFIDGHRAEIVRSLETGMVRVSGQHIPLSAVSRRRIEMLRYTSAPWPEVWPELKLLSAWTDAGAAPFAQTLRRHFDGVQLQGKGLLATEAPVTVPLLGADAPVPLVDEVLLEFERDDGTTVPIDQLSLGDEATVIVSQTGGLVRYRSHDRIRVESWYQRTPCLRFLGRDNLGSDLVGEKLGEMVVRQAVARVFGAEAFAVLVPSGEQGTAGYVCVTDQGDGTSDKVERLEAELCRVFHYRQARLLGQLTEVRIVRVPDLRARYESVLLRRGLKWGDIKYAALLPDLTEGERQRLVCARGSTSGWVAK